MSIHPTFSDLIELLLKCPSMQYPDRRQMIINRLSFAQLIPRGTSSQDDAINIIETAINYPKGLNNVADAVFFVERETLAWKEFSDLVHKLGPDDLAALRAQPKPLHPVPEATTNTQRANLDSSQQELLERMVEAAIPDKQKEPFRVGIFYGDNKKEASLFHPGFGSKPCHAHPSDLEELREQGLVTIKKDKPDVWTVHLKKPAFEYYNSSKGI